MSRCLKPDCMEHRAEENLRAAEFLVAVDDCLAPAVSRAYYAAYQATWAAMTHCGVEVPQKVSGRYFGHKTLPAEAAAQGVLDEDLEITLDTLEGLRVMADYLPNQIEQKTAERAIAEARLLLEQVLDGDEDDEG